MRIKKDTKLILDCINIILGILIVLLAVFAFIHFANRESIFVFIFLLGGIMNLVMGARNFINKKKLAGCFYGILGLALIMMSVLTFLNL